MLKILLSGYDGKMGRVIQNLVNAQSDLIIAAGVGILPTHESTTFPTFTDIFDCDTAADVIIDFTTASVVPRVLDYAVAKKLPVVICTTGIKLDGISHIHEAKNQIPVFRSANMSLGINLLSNLMSKISSLLYDSGFDIEIIEKHHNEKIDAPSGTALMLADSVKTGIDTSLANNYDRSQSMKKRERNELGIMSLRGGTIVGEHSVVFAGKDEVLEFKHSALSKEIFAVGALKAAKYLAGKEPGLYDMQSLMNDVVKIEL